MTKGEQLIAAVADTAYAHGRAWPNVARVVADPVGALTEKVDAALLAQKALREYVELLEESQPSSITINSGPLLEESFRHTERLEARIIELEAEIAVVRGAA